MQERSIHRVLDRLAEYDVQLEPVAALENAEIDAPQRIRLLHAHGVQAYNLVYAPTLNLTTIRRMNLNRFDGDAPVLLIGPRVHDRSAETFRSAGLQFIDEAGNASLRFGGVFIDARGRVLDTHEDDFDTAPGEANLFSPKRSQVIFALLTWPILLGAPLRHLAHAAGVSVGQAQSTVKLLEAHGFVLAEDDQVHVSDDLLDLWTAAYPTGLGPSLTLKSFAGDLERELHVEDAPVYISGETAVRDLRGAQTLTVYVDEFTPALAGRNRWRKDREPNVFIKRKFWSAPYEEGSASRLLRTAPLTLVYADLMSSRDGRLREVAAGLRTIIAPPR